MTSYVVNYDLKQMDNAAYLKENGLKAKSKDDLFLVKYDKGRLNRDNVYTLGQMRSVIVKDGHVVSFSPPKSIDFILFKERYNINDCMFEEFVEGTMLHCFFDEKWQISTKSVIGAWFRGSSEQDKSFKDMFMEAMIECKVTFDHLDKTYSYIFILQHPENRIVAPFEKPSLVLLKIYKTGEMITEQNIYSKEFDALRALVSVPKKFKYTQWEDVENCHDRLDWVHPGIMMYAPDGSRSKIRNKKYEQIKNLKGNNFKTQYQYLNLRKERKIGEFLKYYPELKESFSKYRNDVHSWTLNLYRYYVEFKIKRQIKNTDIPYEYRPHLFNIHNIYMNEGRKINFQTVIQYVNDLPPQRIMFAMNYPLRQIRTASSAR
tara:strand:- start:8674 stop:9798 length:1125 start_codon:yes stop_codon:yes gene_type:complete